MKIEQIWHELNEEAATCGNIAWLTRFALPRPSQPLLVAVEVAFRRRALLLPMPRVVIPAQNTWPECRGLEIFTVELNGVPHFGVRLLDEGCADVFCALAEDLALRVSEASSLSNAASTMVGRLRRWQKFLEASPSGLSVSRLRGLYGELYVLRKYFLPALGSNLTLASWRAPKAAHQDFQLSAGAVEIKTTTGKAPLAVRITSERQLDDRGISVLFLHVVVLDEREVTAERGAIGESLPEIVSELRLRFTGEEQVGEAFEDRLLDAGYLEIDTTRYRSRRFALRDEYTFRIDKGFPRILESDLAAGIGDVSYALALAACEAFAIQASEMMHILAEYPSTAKSST